LDADWCLQSDVMAYSRDEGQCKPTGGSSSADCKCDVPGLGVDHGQTERCGYPFTFGDGNGFVNQETGLVEADPKGCKGEINSDKDGGCFDGMFI